MTENNSISDCMQMQFCPTVSHAEAVSLHVLNTFTPFLDTDIFDIVTAILNVKLSKCLSHQTFPVIHFEWESPPPNHKIKLCW